MGVGHRGGVHAGGNETGDVGHVNHQVGAHLVCDAAEGGEVDDAGVGGCAGDDDLGLLAEGLLAHLVHVEALGLLVDAVGADLVELAGEVGRRAVSEVAAVVEAHAHDLVARLDEGGVGSLVGLGAGVGLHVGVASAEELAGAVAGEVLDEVDLLAAAVVALAGVALGVLVGEDGAHSLHDGGAGDVL